MLVFFGFLLTIFFGLLLTFLIIPKMHPVERLGVSYVLGLGLLTLFMFFNSLAGFNFTLPNTLITLLISILVLLILTRKKIKPFVFELKSVFSSLNQFSRIEKIIVLAISFLVFYSLICTLYWPVHSWDAVSYYDFRAKVFFETGSMDEAIKRGYFFGYPLMTSLAHTWVYLLGGKTPLFIYTLFFASFLMMFYGALREFISRNISLITGFLLATTPAILGHSTFAYTNLPYTVYFVMGTVYLYIWMVKQKERYFILSALMVGLSTWTRISEPFWLTNLLILILYSLQKRKFLPPVFYSLLLFSIQQPWKMFEVKMLGTQHSTAGAIQKSIFILMTKLSIERIVEVLIYVWRSAILPNILFFCLFLLAILIQVKEIFKEKNFWFLILIFGDLFLILVGSYIFSFIYPEWKEISGSLGRMVMFFPPLIIFYLGISGVIEGVMKGVMKK
jgi:hypothetical protein